MAPRVSVLIPVYNCEAFLGSALDSVLAQTYTDYEIVVVDDGSTDGTAAVAAGYAQVRLIRNGHHGISASRNLAIDNARGEFIAFLDGDDLWTPDKLEKQIAYMDSHPESQIVFTDAKNFFDGDPDTMSDRQRELLNANLDLYLASSLIRTDLFRKYGNFREDLHHGEDTEWVMRIGACGIKLREYLHEDLYLRRIHDNNISLSHGSVHQSEALSLMAAAIRRARKKA